MKGYYAGEKSIGLGPIVLALSVVAALGFGCLYAMFSHTIQAAGTEDLSAPTQQEQQAIPSSAGAPAKPKHNHA